MKHVLMKDSLISHFLFNLGVSRYWLSMLCLLCIFSLAPSSLLAKDEKKSHQRGALSTPVVIAIAVKRQMAPFSWISGTVISRNDAKLATEVEGRLIKVAEVGRRVRVNEIVAKIDSVFIRLQIDELNSAVEREQAQLNFHTQEMKRLKKLAAQNNAAQTRLEQTTADKQIARSDLNIAKTRLLKAKEELARHDIRAPFAGVISERLKRVGERAKIGDLVVRLIDSKSVEIQARAPLSSVNFVTEGAGVVVKRGSQQESNVAATIRALVPVGNERSRMMDLRLNFDAPRWRVGQSVRVALPTAEAKEVLTVPRDALVLRRGGTSIFRMKEDNSVEKLSVTLGIAAGDLIEVHNSSLRAGDRVIIRGGERLRPGQKVNVIVTPASTPTKKEQAKEQQLNTAPERKNVNEQKSATRIPLNKT